jgi:putative sigma-54 modulation protein
VRVNISIRHGTLKAESQEKIEQKVGKLSRLNDKVSSVNVTVDLEREETPSVELRVTVDRTKDFVAQDSTDNLLSSVDSVIHKIEEQLRRHKKKLTDRRHSGPRHSEIDGALPDERS